MHNRKCIRYVILVILLLLPISLCSCTARESFFDDPVSDELLESALKAIGSDEKGAFLALFDSQLFDIPDEDDEILDRLYQIHRGQMRDYEKIGRYLRGQTVNNQWLGYIECTYKVTTDVDEYVVTLTRSNDDTAAKLYSFYSMRYEDYLARQPTGILGEFSNWNIQQWGLLAYSAISYLFILFALIHCIRHKMRKKWLFMILIFFQGGIGFTRLQNASTISVKAWLFGLSSLVVYPQQGWILTILFPLGAILYWIIPKKLPQHKRDIPAVEENMEETDEEPVVDEPMMNAEPPEMIENKDI